MFPLRAMRKPESTPYVTYGFILINVLVFLWQTTLSQTQLYDLFFQSGFVPCQASDNLLAPNTYFDALRSMFLHGGWLHLIGNMVFLAIFGPNVEAYFGKIRFAVFYLIAGFAASFTHMIFNLNVCIPAIGASGAIYGVMGAFLLLYPAVKISTVAFFFRVPIGTVNVQAFYMLFYFFIVDLINGMGALGVSSTGAGGVAFWAHVGGFVAGLLITFVAIIFKPAPEVDMLAQLDD